MKQISQGIGRWQGAGMMATTLLGTGVFILPQMTVEIAGEEALWAWILLTLAIVPVTLIFGKLASRFAHAAGPAYFVERAFGNAAGRVVGLLFICVVPIGASAAIIMTFMFVEQIIVFTGWHLLIAQLSCLLLLLAINVRGIHVSAKLQFFLTLAIVFLVCVLFGFAELETANIRYQSLDHINITSAAGIAFWSFLGVEAMSHLSNDFKNPKRDMIPAMMFGTVLVGVIYLMCTILVLNHDATPSDMTLVLVFNTSFSAHGNYVIGALGIAASLATVNVYTASLARLMCSFAEQGILPSYLSHKNAHQTPLNALMTLFCVIALVLIVTYIAKQNLEDLINWVNGVFVLIYAAAMLSAWRLLSKSNRPFILLSLMFCVAMGIGVGAHMIYAFLLVLIVTPCVLLQQKFKSRTPALS